MFQPGDVVQWYAARYGWRLGRRNVFVEGETDATYFELGSKLHRKRTGLELLGDGFRVIPVGLGKAGGTYGMKENLAPLWKLIEDDCSKKGKPLYRVIAMVDDDYEGNLTCKYLTDRFLRLKKYRDVFVLKRRLPRDSQDPKRLEESIKTLNAPWRDLDCEIEDLLSRELLETFVKETGGSVRGSPVYEAGGHHFEFTMKGKGDLCRWVKEAATHDDLILVIETIKALRYYCGLNPEGENGR